MQFRGHSAAQGVLSLWYLWSCSWMEAFLWIAFLEDCFLVLKWDGQQSHMGIMCGCPHTFDRVVSQSLSAPTVQWWVPQQIKVSNLDLKVAEVCFHQEVGSMCVQLSNYCKCNFTMAASLWSRESTRFLFFTHIQRDL